MKLRILTLLLCSLISFSCKSTKRTHDLAPPNENVKVEISEADKESILEFEKQFSQSIEDQDPSFLEDRFNFKELINIAAKGVEFRGKEKKGVMAGVQNGARQSKKRIIGIFTTSRFKYIKFVHKTRPALLYRILMADGTFTYGEFHLAKRSSGEWEIVDMNLYSNGKPTSAIMRDSLAQLLGSSKQNKAMQSAFEEVPNINNDIHNGSYQRAWDKWQKIDPKAHKNRAIMTLGYTAAFQLYYEDPTKTEQLKKVNRIMNKNFPDDPGVAIMELALHEINEDYDKYREAVEKIRSTVGNDIFLDLLLAGADIEEGKYDKAIQVTSEFLKEEPEMEIAYSLMWYAYAGKKDYGSLIKSLNEFEAKYGLQVSALKEDEEFDLFFESPEGKAWAKSKTEQ